MNELNRVCDHRNAGFTAKSAMFEHNAEKSQLIDRGIVTKTGLHMYTDEEAKELSGEIIAYNLTEPVTWEEFQCWKRVEQQAYLEALCRKYPGINCSIISEMFGKSHYWTLLERWNMFGLPKAGRGRNNPKVAEAFRRDVVSKVDKPAPTPVAEPVPQPKFIQGFIQQVSIECKAEDLVDAIKQLGLVGTVAVKITQREVDNGLNKVV